MIDWSRYPNFSEAELACPCCGRADMDPVFMDLLQRLRDELNTPLPVSSGYRCPAHNGSVRGGRAHMTGKAADIVISNPRAFLLIDAALRAGVRRIGTRQHGPLKKRFVHIDICTQEDDLPCPAFWTYEAED